MSKLPYEFNKASFEFNPILTEEENKLISDLIKVGQKIKDQSTFKEFLTHVFFRTKESIRMSLRQQDS